MKIEDLKLFMKVVELGSFTAVANALDLPRANVSRRINELEEDLQFKLFHRTTRSLSLTHHGEAYYPALQKAVKSLEEAHQLVVAGARLVSGKIKLGLLAETHDLIQPLLFAFHDQYPDIELDVRSTSNGFNDMFQQGLDLAFHGGALIDSDLVARPLFSLERCVVASPDYIQQHGEPSTIEELPNHSCICFRWPSGEVDDRWRFTDGSITLRPKLISDGVAFTKRAVVMSRGIGFLPKLIVQDELDSGDLIRILPQYSAIEVQSYLLYPPPQTLNRASRILIEYLLTEVPKLSIL